MRKRQTDTQKKYDVLGDHTLMHVWTRKAIIGIDPNGLEHGIEARPIEFT